MIIQSFLGNLFSMGKFKKIMFITVLISIGLYQSDLFMFQGLNYLNKNVSSFFNKENVLKTKGLRIRLFRITDSFIFNSINQDINYLSHLKFTFSEKDTMFFKEKQKKLLIKNKKTKDAKPGDDKRKVLLQIGNKDKKTKISFHGETGSHFSHIKKSYKGTFIKDTFNYPFSKWHLIIPDDRGYIDPLISNYINSKLGLPISFTDIVNVSINNFNQGVYLLEETYNNDYLERNNYAGYTIFTFERNSISNGRFTTSTNVDNFSIKFKDLDNEEDKDKITQITNIIKLNLKKIQNNEPEYFISNLDKKHTAAFIVWAILNGKDHDIELYNLRYAYNLTSGKFFPVPRLESPIKNINIDILHRDLLISTIISNADIFNYINDSINDIIIKDLFNYVTKIEEEYKQMYLSDSLIHEPYREINNKFNTKKDILSKNYSLLHNLFNKRKENINSESVEINSKTYQGVTHITQDTVLPSNQNITVKAGATFILDPGVSFVSYSPMKFEGTKWKPITIKSSDKEKPFGVFSIQGTDREDCKTEMDYVNVENGYEAFVQGVYYSGMFNIYHCDADVQNSIFTNGHADDGLNIKYGDVVIKDNIFKKNFADQADLDVVKGIVEGNTFSNSAGDSNGDGLDLSGSHVLVKNNIFEKFKDKGISIGEKTDVYIEDNIFERNTLGAAVKDLSNAYFRNNTYKENEQNITAYKKKVIFGGGNVYTEEIEKKSVDLDKESNHDILSREELISIRNNFAVYE